VQVRKKMNKKQKKYYGNYRNVVGGNIKEQKAGNDEP